MKNSQNFPQKGISCARVSHDGILKSFLCMPQNIVITHLAAKKHGNVKGKLGLQHPNWENQHVMVSLGEEWPTSHSKCSSWLVYMNFF